MTDQDNSAGPSVSGEDERERAIQAVVAHAAARDVLYSRVRDTTHGGGWMWGVSAILLFLSVVLFAYPPAWVRGTPRPTLARAELERGVRAAILLQAQQVEAFRVANGRLPDSVEELPARVEGLRYVRTDNRMYQIVGIRPDGLALVYDSSRPLPGFDGVAAPWLRRRP